MRLYVGNLAVTVTEADLAQVFGPYGLLGPCLVHHDPSVGRKTAYGLVQVKSGLKAVKDLDGKEFKGKAVKVSAVVERLEKNS